MLDGDQIRLRSLRRADAAAVGQWLHDPEVNRWMVLGRTAPSAETWVARLADAWPRDCVMAIMPVRPLDRASPALGRLPDAPCGVIGLFDIDWLQRRASKRSLP